MSKEHIKSVFRETSHSDAWSLQLLKINNSKRKGTSYYTREILLLPDGKLKSLISQLSTHYLSDNGIDKFDTVDIMEGEEDGRHGH